jgi:hypothetical protein
MKSTQIGYGYTLMLILTTCMMVLSSCSNHQVGASATDWSTQLALAEREAQKIDREAVLEHVLATETTQHEATPTTGDLNVRFTFVRPSGSLIDVSFPDTKPSSI